MKGKIALLLGGLASLFAADCAGLEAQVVEEEEVAKPSPVVLTAEEAEKRAVKTKELAKLKHEMEEAKEQEDAVCEGNGMRGHFGLLTFLGETKQSALFQVGCVLEHSYLLTQPKLPNTMINIPPGYFPIDVEMKSKDGSEYHIQVTGMLKEGGNGYVSIEALIAGEKEVSIIQYRVSSKNSMIATANKGGQRITDAEVGKIVDNVLNTLKGDIQEVFENCIAASRNYDSVKYKYQTLETELNPNN